MRFWCPYFLFNLFSFFSSFVWSVFNSVVCSSCLVLFVSTWVSAVYVIVGLTITLYILFCFLIFMTLFFLVMFFRLPEILVPFIAYCLNSLYMLRSLKIPTSRYVVVITCSIATFIIANLNLLCFFEIIIVFVLLVEIAYSLQCQWVYLLLN